MKIWPQEKLILKRIMYQGAVTIENSAFQTWFKERAFTGNLPQRRLSTILSQMYKKKLLVRKRIKHKEKGKSGLPWRYLYDLPKNPSVSTLTSLMEEMK